MSILYILILFLCVTDFAEMVEHKESSIEKFEKFTWKIENFSRLNKRVYYEHFVIGGYPWRINLHPKGNDKPTHLSIFLEAVKTAHMSEGWSRNVEFKLVIFNQLNADMSIIRESKNEFNASKDHWGFRSFMPLVKLRDPKKGFIVKDAFIIGVEVYVLKSIHEKQVNQAVNLAFETETGHTKMDAPLSKVKDPGTELEFAAIGRVIYFLKSRKVKHMNEQACKELQALWDELAKFEFDLTWLEPHVQSVFAMNSFVEKALPVEKLNENIIILELEMARLKAKLVTAKLNLDIEKDFLKAKGLIEIDLDSELGHGSCRQ